MPEQRNWRELLGAALRPSRGQAVIAVALAVVGFALVSQVSSNHDSDTYASLRRADLVQLLDSLNAESQRLDSEIRGLEQTRRELESASDAQQVADQQAQERIDTLGILAGTLPAHGAGVRITILDPHNHYNAVMLLDAVEELRDAGAEAIEINDSIRVVGSSWITDRAGEMVVDGISVTRPVKLDVIGDPHALEEGARFRGGLVSEAESEQVGGTVLIERRDDVRIGATRAAPQFSYARPS